MNTFITFIVCLCIVFLAGGIGSIATTPNIETWYATLQKPTFNPPNWVFGPVWTLLYALMATSLFLLWKAPASAKRRQVLIAFGVQLALNTAWSLVFFGLHSPVGALIIIAALLVSILVVMRKAWSINRTAALILIPYIVWVSFATCLNTAIVILN